MALIILTPEYCDYCGSDQGEGNPCPTEGLQAVEERYLREE